MVEGASVLRAARVLSFLSATESSEHARWTAPLKSSPSSLEATSDASDSIRSLPLVCFRWAWGGVEGGGWYDSVLICSLITLVGFQVWTCNQENDHAKHRTPAASL